ncbi:MAG TPA: sucrase ferredoxin, partial [Nocardioides sp.]|nr:sucrase ferredoxin [Nocardioides sp.]
AGRSPGLETSGESLLCVCTHGRHDACCAERGRPVASALAAAHPDQTWEISHIGGDRFAGNALFLPHGLYYGRLDAVSSIAVAGRHLGGHLDLDHLRGRSSYPMPVQVAEIGLRRQLGETRLDALRLVSHRRDGDLRHARFAVTGSEWEVTVRSRPGADLHRLTCRARRDNAVPQHEVLDIHRR